MESVKASPRMPGLHTGKVFNLAVILVILAAIGLSTYTAFNAARSQDLHRAATVISQQALADDYGLGVNLVAVTAAGGMVDLRLRIVDGEKAKALLENQTNFPEIRTSDGVILQASQNVASQTIKYDNGYVIFVLYPNAQSAVKSGDPVSILFGDVQVDSILAK
jgi:hypothetical protein